MTEADKILTMLKQQAKGLLMQAEACEITASHFRPRFLACWEWTGGMRGRLVDIEQVYFLKTLVLGNEKDAARFKSEAMELFEACAYIEGLQK